MKTISGRELIAAMDKAISDLYEACSKNDENAKIVAQLRIANCMTLLKIDKVAA